MTRQRLTALFMTLVLALNSSAPAWAENVRHEPDKTTEKSATVKTVTLTADALPGKYTSLNREQTFMLDNEDTLQNAEGVVDTQIQGTYHKNQTLVSTSLSGTSFSFVPIMLDEYYPSTLEEPSESPEPSETPAPSDSPEESTTSTAAESVLPSAIPDQTPAVSPTASETPLSSETPSQTPESTATATPDQTPEITTEPTASSEPTDTPEPATTEQPTNPPETMTPTSEPTASEETPSAFLLDWLFPRACAEGSEPSVITGQRISTYSRDGGVGTVVYPGLFDAVTDVYLSALTTGVKENIIVNAYTGNHVYSYALNTVGLSAVQSGQEILLNDENGNMLEKNLE